MLLALALAAQSLFQPVAAAQEPTRLGWLGVALEIEEGRDRPLSTTEIAEGSPAERAGLQPGDRLIAFDGRALDSYEALVELLREYGPGREVTLTLRRALDVELDDRGWGAHGGPRLGVHLGQLDAAGGGARWVVKGIEKGWPAARAGVQAGDRIVALAGREPADFDELQSVLADVEPQDELELVIERDLGLRLGERRGEAATRAPTAGGRLRLLPHVESVRPEPAPPRAGADELERRLREEIVGLNAELRALREELRSLRRELAELRVR